MLRHAPLAPLALLPFLALGATPMTTSAQAGLPPSGFEVGEPFPALAFPSAEDGEPISLADFRGHKVIVHVFASW